MVVKAIIFDLNGIFIKSPKLSDRFAEKFGIQPIDFLPVLHEVMSVIRRPNANQAFSYWEPHLQRWKINLSEEEFYRFWFTAEKVAEEMVSCATTLKEDGFHLFILSNNFAERAAYYTEHFPFLSELFVRVYYSWQTGFVKPSREALELVLDENQLHRQQVLYFDDSEANIALARELGIQARIFQSVPTFKQDIQQLLTIQL